MGTSSLLTYREDIDQAWPGRNDFKAAASIEVDIITLRDFALERRISRIDYLHTDVQGVDLQVLKGLGDMLNLVKAGDIDCARNHQTKIYEQEEYVLENIILYLYQIGFRVNDICKNDDKGLTPGPHSLLQNANELIVHYVSNLP